MLENKKLFLLDIDGTICKGNQLIEGAAAFLKDIKTNGGQFVFITNNATKSIDDYIKSFQILGIHTDYTNFLTASYATVDYLKKHHAGEPLSERGSLDRRRPPVYRYFVWVSCRGGDGAGIIRRGN